VVQKKTAIKITESRRLNLITSVKQPSYSLINKQVAHGCDAQLTEQLYKQGDL